MWRAAVKMGATRQELDETLGVTPYMGGGPSLMSAANAIAAFDEFSRAAAARTA
jgi:alkylhydroperoxidase/carboxymuconolactone decarboxylase family protein YurZ